VKADPQPALPNARRISGRTVRADFNALESVLLYTRAAHRLGLWESERALIERIFPDRAAPLLEAGCGAGRATLGLWDLGYLNLSAFDFAEELLEQARSLATERGATGIRFFAADATRLSRAVFQPAPPASTGGLKPRLTSGPFAGALFLFNGLMQIPGRRNRRRALRNLAAVVRTGGRLLFTTHDRDDPKEREPWAMEAKRWQTGTQDPRLREFGDRYFAHEHGHTFMHLPDRGEILADLAATGWVHEFDAPRREIAAETQAVRDFSDECRFWGARRE
jgi:SAM-dependent methyltransferase